jgi:glycosyltransferase involved in cell wall biosynthesis
MRILVGADTPPDPNSGAAGTVYATNVALRGLGHQVDEIWAGDLSHHIKHWNLHYMLELPRSYRSVVANRCRQKDYDVIQLSQPYAWMAARDHHQRRRPGIVVNRSHGLESLADTALSSWHKRLGVPESRFPRSLATPFIRSRLHRQIDRVVRHADGLIVPASDIREKLVHCHGADPDRVEVVHHGVPDAYLEVPRPPMTRERLKRMLYVGQFSFIKGPRLLAEAAAKILTDDPEVRLTWVSGRAHHGEILAMFRPELRNRLDLLDWMAQDRLLALYDEHGMYLAHALYEGAAKACTEAMARGQVVVTSRVGALKDHIEHGHNGLVVEVGDTVGMADAALEVLADFPRAVRIANAAAHRASLLSWQNCARTAVHFYQRLLGQSGRNQ